MWETLELNEKIISCKEILIDKNRTEYGGYLIKTKSQTIEILLDTFNTCCETADCVLCDNVDNYNKEPLNTDLLENKILKTVHLEDFDRDFPSIVVVLTMENNEKYYIVLYNVHDGYYPHSYSISWNNFCDTGRL